MRSRQRKIQKERLFNFCPLINVLRRFFRQRRQNVFKLPARSHGTVYIDAGGCGHGTRYGFGGQGCDAIIFDKGVWRIVGHIGAKIIVEAARDGAGSDRLIEHHFFTISRPAPAQMPFADTGRVIALLFEHPAKG